MMELPKNGDIIGGSRKKIKQKMTNRIPGTLQTIIDLMAKLPGLGPRSARRTMLYLLHHKDTMRKIINALCEVESTVTKCEKCNNIDIQTPCHICRNERRDKSIICIVENIGELWAMERSLAFKGNYYVLGGLLSALEGMTPENLQLAKLENRIIHDEVKEIIIAISATLDGQTTAYYIADALSKYDIKVSRLAFGIPIGAELEYMDEGTLSIALKLRQNL
ncbi:Recombination protein RecR [Alphaproteobacteria bacterium]